MKLHIKYQRPGPKRILKGFIYTSLKNGHGSHLGHLTQMRGTNFSSPYPLRLHMNFVLFVLRF